MDLTLNINFPLPAELSDKLSPCLDELEENGISWRTDTGGLQLSGGGTSRTEFEEQVTEFCESASQILGFAVCTVDRECLA